MRYRIGEVADLFGLTKEGVRYYERKGIIRSIRDENTGYRFFLRDEITRLKQIRSYQSLGFSLEESQYMTVETPCEEVEPILADKMEELRKKQDAIAWMMEEIRRQQSAARRFRMNQIDIRRVPAMFFFKRVPDEESGATKEQREEIIRARNDEKAWINAMPPVTLCAMHYDRHLNPVSSVFGSCVLRETAESLNLPTQRALLLPQRLCLCGAAQAPLGEKPDIRRMAGVMREQGYRLCGDVYGELRFAYRHADGRRWGVHDLYLPIEQNDGENSEESAESR